MSAQAEAIRDRILKLDDRKSVDLEVTDWGITVTVLALTTAQRCRVMEECFDPATGKPTLSKMYPDVVIMSACIREEDGKLAKIFTSKDRAALLEKDGRAVGLIAETCLKLSGLHRQQIEGAKANFTGITNGDSSSSLPESSAEGP